MLPNQAQTLKLDLHNNLITALAWLGFGLFDILLFMKYKAIIFDFNGVLLWDRHFHETAWNRISLKLRNKPFTLEEMAVHMHGVEGRIVIDYLLGRKCSDAEFNEILKEKEEMYRKMCLDNPKEFVLSPGAIELLNFFKENNIPRAIATTSPKINMDFFVKELNLNQWFEKENCISIDGTFPGKPFPDIYLRTAKILKHLPGDCIVIEDAPSGIKAATSAGIGYVIALGPKEKLAKVLGVNEVIENLSQLNRKLFL